MHLKELRESNEDLTQLIRDVSKLASARFKPSRHMLCSRKAPQDIGRIRALSDKLHQAMNESWCCQEPSHVTHFAKLCVDAEVDRGVARLDMVIAFGQGSTGDQVDGRYRRFMPFISRNVTDYQAVLRSLNLHYGYMYNLKKLAKKASMHAIPKGGKSDLRTMSRSSG